MTVAMTRAARTASAALLLLLAAAFPARAQLACATMSSSVAGCAKVDGTTIVSAGGVLSVEHASLDLPMIPTEAALAATSTLTYSSVIRLDYSVGLGSPPIVYSASPAPCSLAAGAGDGATQVPSVNGKCWLGSVPEPEPMEAWGADPTGATDSLFAFTNSSLTRGTRIAAGNYLLSGPIIPVNGVYWVAGNPHVSQLIASTANLPIVSCPSGVAFSGVSGFYIARNLTATAGGDFLDCQGTSSAVIEDMTFDNNYIVGQWHVAVLGNTDTSYFRNNFSVNSGDISVLFQPASGSTYNALQWDLTGTKVGEGVGASIVIDASTSSLSGALTFGPWIDIATFASCGGGVRILGNSTTSIAPPQLLNAFLGGDGADEYYDDSYSNGSAGSLFVNGQIELAGTGPCGPNLATPATHTGRGLNLTANNGVVSVGSLLINATSYEAILTAASKTFLNSIVATNSGQKSGYATPVAVLVTGGQVFGNGGRYGNEGGNTTQTFGFDNVGGTLHLSGPDLSVNQRGPVSGTYDGCFIGDSGPVGLCGAVGQIPGTATNDNASAGHVGEYIASSSNGASATVTITNASPSVITWTTNEFSTTEPTPVNFTTTGALPTGLTVGTTYYTVPASVTTNTFKVATTIANAFANTPVNTSSAGSGTQTAVNAAVLTTGTPISIAGISLTPGDWDVTLMPYLAGGGSTAISYAETGIGTTVNAVNSTSGARNFWADNTTAFAASGVFSPGSVGPYRVPLGTTTTVYFGAQAGFSVSNASAYGLLSARRIR